VKEHRTPTGRARTALRRSLLTWYDKVKRDLPWREKVTPYRVMLSEFMLQQTQVDTVIPYFNRFLDRFPTIEELASAHLDEVLKCWEGLGYYSRARNLHVAAREIVTHHDGRIPDTYDDLARLKGFGPYTTAAILSIAYGAPYAVVDGNVIRVLSRLCAIEEDVAKSGTKRAFTEIAQALLDTERPGDYNQALMDLGATVCAPRDPDCTACPIADPCKARTLGIQRDLPRKSKRPPRKQRTEVAVILRRDTALLVARRPDDGLLGGMWEFPTVPAGPKRLKSNWGVALSKRTGLNVTVERKFQTLHHTFTHFDLELHAYEGAAEGDQLLPVDYSQMRWVPETELNSLAFSRIHRRLADALSSAHQLEFSI
jgi:A/G-specific adenine glycosylase